MYVRQIEVAEDIVSDVFFNCWKNRRKLAEVEKIDTYLFVAVKNHSLNYIKKISRIQLVKLEDSNEFEFLNAYNPQDEMEAKELMFKLEQAVEVLPQQCRIIFKLIKEDNLQYKEVAKILDISPSTVKNQLYRAMQRLNFVLSEYNAQHINLRILPVLIIFMIFFKYFLLACGSY